MEAETVIAMVSIITAGLLVVDDLGRSRADLDVHYDGLAGAPRFAARVHLVLAEKGHEVEVAADGSRIRIEVQRYTANLDRLAAKLVKLASAVDGVGEVECIPGSRFVPPPLVRQLKPGGRMVVLDFGIFRSWGPLAPVMRTWLKLNHVLTRRPYLDRMREVCGDIDEYHWLGGYNFTAVARRND